MKKRNFYIILLFLITPSIFYISSCKKSDKNLSTVQLNYSKLPYKKLSDYGFFKGDLNKFNPNPRVLKYEPISSLFSDHASKSRFVWMPKNKSAHIQSTDEGRIVFPEGSVLIKNFYYLEEPNQINGNKNIIETRLLIKINNKWEAFPYLWNKEQTDAIYKITGSTLPVTFVDNKNKLHEINYVQPNKNQCKSCHNKNEELMPIGPKARNLNFEFNYSTEEKLNQLKKWADVGYLNNYNDSIDYKSMVNYNDPHQNLNDRARSYLDINCGHCHHEDAPASTSGMFLNYEEKDLYKLGVMKPPIAAGAGSGSFDFGIVPGNADESILTYRMKSKKVGIMMPEIGRVMIDQDGINLISEWINQMK